MRILLAEDDQRLGRGLSTGLERYGFRVDWVQDGMDAEHAILSGIYSAVVLDLGLPSKDGLDVLKVLRSRNVNTPILILTARKSISDQVVSLEAGADRYVTKPVELVDLAARLRALIRRTQGRLDNLLSVGDITLNPIERRVMRAGVLVDITPREYELLYALMWNIGRVLTREEIEQQIYKWGQDLASNTVEVYIHHLRRKLGSNIIHTVRGIGYTVRARSSEDGMNDLPPLGQQE